MSTEPPAGLTAADLLDHHGACTEAVAWAAGTQDLADLWARCPHAGWMVWVLGRLHERGYLDAETSLRRFAVDCVRRIEVLLVDPRSRAALEAAARVADRRADPATLSALWPGARDAARAHTQAARWCASTAAAATAAAHLVRPRAHDAAWAVSRHVIRAVAWHPDGAVTAEAEEARQIVVLHALVDPAAPQVFSRVWDDFLMGRAREREEALL